MTDQLDMFPELPAPRVTPPRPWRPGPTDRLILDTLHTPMTERQIHERLVMRASGLTRKALGKRIEQLGRRGWIQDTGERGDWTRKGREIVWRRVK